MSEQNVQIRRLVEVVKDAIARSVTDLSGMIMQIAGATGSFLDSEEAEAISTTICETCIVGRTRDIADAAVKRFPRKYRGMIKDLFPARIPDKPVPDNTRYRELTHPGIPRRKFEVPISGQGQGINLNKRSGSAIAFENYCRKNGSEGNPSV